MLPLVIVARHTYLISTTSLTRWKGGGFGMYTEPHPVLRSLWAKDTLDKWRLIYPLKKEDARKLPEEALARFRESAHDLRRAIYNPPEAHDLLEKNSWLQYHTGRKSPNYKIVGIELDLPEKKLKKVEIDLNE